MDLTPKAVTSLTTQMSPITASTISSTSAPSSVDLSVTGTSENPSSYASTVTTITETTTQHTTTSTQQKTNRDTTTNGGEINITIPETSSHSSPSPDVMIDPDDRASAKVLGGIGVFLLIGVLCIIFIMDLDTYARNFSYLKRNIKDIPFPNFLRSNRKHKTNHYSRETLDQM